MMEDTKVERVFEEFAQNRQSVLLVEAKLFFRSGVFGKRGEIRLFGDAPVILYKAFDLVDFLLFVDRIGDLTDKIVFPADQQFVDAVVILALSGRHDASLY